jgi:hypothetical protein
LHREGIISFDTHPIPTFQHFETSNISFSFVN